MLCIRMRQCVLVGTVLCLVILGPEGARAAPLDPFAFQSLGVFPTTPGHYLIGLNGVNSTLTGPGGVAITGTFSNGITVFDFTTITLGADQSLQILTHGPVAFLSRTGIAVAGTIDASGSGGFGGFRGSAFFGVGPGGGRPGITGIDPVSRLPYSTGGGGGGFGGAGGNGVGVFGGPSALNVPGGAGGGPYANLVYSLQAGSGGGASLSDGGNGGGAIELGAIGPIAIGGMVMANGLAGSTGSGGGSGGGILIHGDSVQLTGQLIAGGGAGGAGNMFGGIVSSGGGGGGGEVVILTSSVNGFSGSLASINVAGGGNGQPGVVQVAVVPEPAGLVQAATAVLMVGGYGWCRRRRCAVAA